MSTIYRFLGLMAWSSFALRFIRLRFLRADFAALLGLAALLWVGLHEIRDGMANGTAPRVSTLAQVLDGRESAHSYITLQGEMHPEARLGYGLKPGADGSVPLDQYQQVWVPLIQTGTQRALLVETGMRVANPQPYAATVTGMLRPMDSVISDQIDNATQHGELISGLTVHTDYVLVEGARPSRPEPWIVAVVVASVLLVGIATTMTAGYVVFQETELPAAASVPALALDFGGRIPSTSEVEARLDETRSPGLRATGLFTMLYSDEPGYFVEIPVAVGESEAGDMVFGSHNSTDKWYQGAAGSREPGLWRLGIPHQAALTYEPGRLYWGRADRPALRLHAEAPDFRGTLYVSCGTEAELLRLVAHLQTRFRAFSQG